MLKKKFICLIFCLFLFSACSSEIDRENSSEYEIISSTEKYIQKIISYEKLEINNIVDIKVINQEIIITAKDIYNSLSAYTYVNNEELKYISDNLDIKFPYTINSNHIFYNLDYQSNWWIVSYGENGDVNIFVYDLETKETTEHQLIDNSNPSNRIVRETIMGNDDSFLIAMEVKQKSIFTIIDTKTYQILNTITMDDYPDAVNYQHGKIYSLSSNILYITDAKTGKILEEIKFPKSENKISSIAINGENILFSDNNGIHKLNTKENSVENIYQGYLKNSKIFLVNNNIFVSENDKKQLLIFSEI